MALGLRSSIGKVLFPKATAFWRLANSCCCVTRFFDVNNEFVGEVDYNSDGADVYLSNKRLAQAYISKNKMHSTNSYTLSGVKNGKRIYKNTYALRLE